MTPLTKSCSVGLGVRTLTYLERKGRHISTHNMRPQVTALPPPTLYLLLSQSRACAAVRGFFQICIRSWHSSAYSWGKGFTGTKIQSRLPGVAQALCALGMPPSSAAVVLKPLPVPPHPTLPHSACVFFYPVFIKTSSIKLHCRFSFP